jgi:diguanylate cyclase (GGDEF)-like protein
VIEIFGAIAAGVLLGWWLSRRGVLPVARRRKRRIAVAEEGVDAPQGRVVPLDETRELLRAAFRPEEMPDPEQARRADRHQLSRALADVADLHGADRAVLWSVASGPDGAIELVASSEREDPAVLTGTVRDLAVWAAREGMLAFDRSSDAPLFAAIAVTLHGPAGVLTVHQPETSKVPREAFKGWMPRHAAALSALHELVRTRAETARSNFRLRATVRSAMTLQGMRDPLGLETALVSQALEVAGAQWAALVRWDWEKREGTVRATSLGDAGGDPPATVPEGSVVGGVCTDGVPLVFEDALAKMSDPGALFGGWPVPAATGSLLIVPVRRGKEVDAIGALICGHADAGALTQADARTTQELGVIAAGALDTAWAVAAEREVARTDPLTGLANRRKFEEIFAHSIALTDRHEGTQLALVLVDIDFFKKVNDTYGHEAGDAVLQAVAKALGKERRAVDAVARMGGEEMALILPHTDADGAREVAERLRERIERTTVHTNVGQIQVTASFGVAVYSSRGGDADTVFERADKALYEAKHLGRNRVAVAP